MKTAEKYTLRFGESASEALLQQGLFLAISFATRIPPHIGMITGGEYHSLNIKGQDKNVPLKAYFRSISQRRIPCFFVHVRQQPSFSETYLSEHFVACIEQFPKVETAGATCLSPVKIFFEDVYQLAMEKVNFLYELLPLLESEGLIIAVHPFNLDTATYQLPVYSGKEIIDGIEEARVLQHSFGQLKIKQQP